MDAERDVLITDVVLRDGLQDEPISVAPLDRVRVARRLLDAGLVSLEVGAFASLRRVPQMAGSDAVLRTLVAESTAALYTLVFTEFGAQQAVEAGARSVRVVVSATDRHSSASVGVSTAEALDRLGPAFGVLQAAGVTAEACVAPAFVCAFDGDIPPERAAATARRLVELGAVVVHLADTVGAAQPGAVTRTVAAVRDVVPDVPLGLHLHDTHGMARANAWTAFQLGITRFDAAIGGLGGCPFAPGSSGNIATEDLVQMFHREGIRTGIDPEKLRRVRDELSVVLGHAPLSALSRVPPDVPGAAGGDPAWCGPPLVP
ncbi:hydroxymethylglutaryl-CoA lyase [Pseudonocardia xinjiangensis]|uniref:Hydroxymethylglutaryl-CoA lyase n=2 Tax=Pseudonocardia xinjiangensis TaxID=75289 RepID=A0ABX1RBV4_9PSEU|nr:hydroxymethylglutaryl-CoA lyase [Pseudonocardia xinjiangensis]